MSRIKYFLFVVLTMLTTNLFAQEEKVDFLRSVGKIYVVVAVLVAIFIGIVLFLIYFERKLSKLENQIKDNE